MTASFDHFLQQPKVYIREDQGIIRELQAFGPLSNRFDYEWLGRLPKLRKLTLDEMALDDGIWEHISKLTELECLSITRCRTIYGEGLHHLSQLTKLKSLDLKVTSVGEDQCRHLVDLDSLIELDLLHTSVIGNFLSMIGSNTKIRELNFAISQFSDVAAENLSRFALLTSLNLASTKITDSGCCHFASLGRLKSLDIHDTRTTERCLEFLCDLPDLRTVYTSFDMTLIGAIWISRMQRIRELYFEGDISQDAIDLLSEEKLSLSIYRA